MYRYFLGGEISFDHNIFEGFSDDLDDEKSFFVDTVLGAREKSTFLEQKNQRTIEGCLYVETPPPENSCI